MCLSTVYDTSDPDRILMEYVSRIDMNGDEITLTDLMGVRRTFTGSLVSADLTGGIVKVCVTDRA